jgi:4'-phosphopantetheinyl transferase
MRPGDASRPGVGPLPLPEAELHVWRASLDRPPAIAEKLEAVLSPDERARAGRFYAPALGARYVIGRGLLRVLLGLYLGAAGAEIEFIYGQHGKPLLGRAGPWFNLAHSGPEALFAFSSSAEVGVDVELADRERASGRVAERFFAPGEVQRLRALPRAVQPRAFLCCWTRKEAFIKARGDGLSLPLNSFEVTLDPDEPPAVVRTAWSTSEPAQWSLVDLSDPGGRIVAAAAGRHPGWRVIRRDADDLLERLPLAPGGDLV